MTWAAWTTMGLSSGPAGVRTDEAGLVVGELNVQTIWAGHHAQVKVQCVGTDEWLTLTGSPLPCASREESMALHQSVVQAIRADSAEADPADVTAGQVTRR